MEFSSKLIESAVNEFSKLPGIGKKTALRLVLHLLKQDENFTTDIAQSLVDMRQNIKYCKKCHNISDEVVCNICKSHKRDNSIICLVEDTRDVLAIENTSQYNGLYHVLGGIISPIEGIGPEDLTIDSLMERVSNSDSEVKEIIFGLSPTMEGDTTAFYISKKVKQFGIKTSTIARGIPIGGELEYADEITLGRSIVSRTAYE
ncbi:recombination protein RecR [Marivirga tractuosa]|uniref:Recombination protein RecR n=1 Tax=Marivirga tractuosa (strain ATCC 23168 / DSM 4126 / NBRC 15989 / NCIMB 1408 / VKM B-1430 / H-43) TaxID=643867 RepID=E4TSY8_MARTH|nr:recombination mediator RecR [Marivirga tractuosa]ADR22929.1 recombination protein RecR [Marivirga tractuosa DSM 4126]BDD16397.1 recombination protein RecR [Marivirga tractuosa]